jgi:hypothetical protein
MRDIPSTPWHKTSFDRFLHQTLSELLVDRLHLDGYRVDCSGNAECGITLSGGASGDPFEVTYPSLPAPDDSGVFRLDGEERIVSPVADADDPAEAQIRCVGEQLLDFIDSRLGVVPDDATLDEALVRALAPLDAWFRAFLAQASKPLASTNWLDRHTHLRRLLIPDRVEVFTPGHYGRTCPFETPEGPNLARILTISRGAEIREGRLIVVDDGPVAGLGLTVSTIPFVEHDDGNRLLMGANMMRQWRAPTTREQALVQTGFEPDDPDFWCGRNLLTAFVSWDGYTFEDAVVISESCSEKLSCPEPLEPGDKVSNRHGIKAVVSRVLPDNEMPHLADGTPIELVFSLSGVPTRWAMGQIREAALGRVAMAKGQKAVVPPFGAPSDDELRQSLSDAGLPENGTEVLTDGGKPLRRPSTVGRVYWGCTIHLVRNKIQASVTPEGSTQRMGKMEVEALLEAGANVVAMELTNTCASEREDAATLSERVSAGDVSQPDSPGPRFVRVRDGLASVGIDVRLEAGGVGFGFLPGDGGRLELARPVAHPWLPDTLLKDIPVSENSESFQAVREANDRLARLVNDQVPRPLIDGAIGQLTGAVADLFGSALTREDLRFGGRVMFCGRSVIAPGPELKVDQLGLPEEMAWTMFGPHVTRLVGDRNAVEQRTERAFEALQAVMAEAWVILNRAPSVTATAHLAFHPVFCRERAIRVHPLACRLLNADFDGDQAAIYLPVSDAAQRETGEKLTIEGHLRRDPGLIRMLFPSMDALFGLACLSLSKDGRESIAGAAGREVELRNGIVTRDTVVEALQEILGDNGPRAALDAVVQLLAVGFQASRAEGGSVGPFLGCTVEIPEPPGDDDLDQWLAYQEEVHAIVAGFRAYDDEDLGAVSLLCHCGARGNVHQVAQLLSPQGPVHDVYGGIFQVRHNWREGLTRDEALARVVGARKGLHRILAEYSGLGAGQEARERPEGHGVLCRARRAQNPGVVIARAAAGGEVDPLEDMYARLFVGIPPS